MASKLFAMFAKSQIMLQSMKKVNIAKFVFNSIKPNSPINPTLSSQSDNVEQVNPIKPLLSQSESGKRDGSRLESLIRSEPIISRTMIHGRDSCQESGRGITEFSGGTLSSLYLEKAFEEIGDNHEHILDSYVEPTEISYKSIDGEQKIVSWEGGKFSELSHYIKELRNVCAITAIDEHIDDDEDKAKYLLKEYLGRRE